MTVEVANYISELNPNWPQAGDLAREGEQHISVTKLATQQSFPNIDAEVSATPAELNHIAGRGLIMPTGVIQMFAGAAAPAGWLLCDGAAIDPQYTDLIQLIGANTPDLRGAFIRGWSDDIAQDPDAPRAPLSTQVEMIGPHTHTYRTPLSSGTTNSGHNIGSFTGQRATQDSRDLNTSQNTGTENRPANTAVLYIIKT